MDCIVHGLIKSLTRQSNFQPLTGGTVVPGEVFPLQWLKKWVSSLGPSSF